MDKSLFFDFQKWDDYLKNDLNGAVSIKSHGSNAEDVFVSSPMEHSVQISYRDFVESHSFTKGNYDRDGDLGCWEELRLRIKVPTHFSEKKEIPPGKYRIRVQKEEYEKPIVKTFIRGFLGWKQKKLPNTIPLDTLIKGNLDDYVFE